MKHRVDILWTLSFTKSAEHEIEVKGTNENKCIIILDYFRSNFMPVG